MRLESGPAAYDRNYNLVVVLLGLAMGSYFFYDHAIGYPKKNYDVAVQHLTPLIGADKIPAAFPEIPSQDDCKKLMASEPASPEAVHQAWGTPIHVSEDNSGTRELYASKYGMAEVPIVGKYVNFKSINWISWNKSKDDIQMQLYCAIVAFLFGLFFLRRAYKASTLRVVIDDEGLVYAGRRVPFADMTKFTNYSKKGWVDLFYTLGAQERKIRFDNQKVGKFDEIIETLCRAKGFADPRKAVEEEDRDDEK